MNISQIIADTKRKIRLSKTSGNIVVRIVVRVLYKLWRIVQTVKGIFVDAGFRSVFLLKLVNSKNVHQTTSLTFMDRYPDIFSTCREYFDGKKDLKILSYGCSTGEEVLTLRRYFPDAQIIGADINKHSLTICRKLSVDKKIAFVYSEFNELQRYGDFDAVFCMAVLQRTPHYIEAEGIRSLKKIYPFEKFERQIVELDKLISLQGLLVIKFTQYSFLDTSVSSKYKSLDNNQPDTDGSCLFDKDSHLVSHPKPQNTIFIKMRK